MFKFKVDENLPIEVATLLAAAGHDASTAPDQGLGGRPDFELIAACQREGRVVITLDRDFSDIRAYPPADYSGIIVFRLSRLDKQRILTTTQRLMSAFDQQPLSGKLWIVDETTIRIRS